MNTECAKQNPRFEEWVNTFPHEYRKECRERFFRPILDEIEVKTIEFEHKFNMKYSPKYKSRFYQNMLIELQKELSDFYRFYQEEIRKNNDPEWRLIVHGLREIKRKEKKTHWLKSMLQTKVFNDQKISEEMIDIAREYPITDLINESIKVRGFMKCPFHEEKTASLYIKNNYMYCFGCGVSKDTIAWVMYRDGIDFKKAVLKIGRLNVK